MLLFNKNVVHNVVYEAKSITYRFSVSKGYTVGKKDAEECTGKDIVLGWRGTCWMWLPALSKLPLQVTMLQQQHCLHYIPQGYLGCWTFDPLPQQLLWVNWDLHELNHWHKSEMISDSGSDLGRGQVLACAAAASWAWSTLIPTLSLPFSAHSYPILFLPQPIGCTYGKWIAKSGCRWVQIAGLRTYYASS